VLRSLFLLALPIAVSWVSQLSAAACRALNANTTFQYGLQEGLTSLFCDRQPIDGWNINPLEKCQWIVMSLMGMGLSALIYSQLHSILLAIHCKWCRDS
jgi:hypothetical protein